MQNAQAFISSPASLPAAVADATTVLRIGLLSDGNRSYFCVLRSISSSSVVVRIYSSVRQGDRVQLRVGDSTILAGTVVWKRGQLARIAFEHAIDPHLLLRSIENGAARRRSSPRVKAAAHATVRTGGRMFAAELCDISTIGTKLRTQKPLTKGSPALLSLPDLPILRGYVRWSDGLLSGFVFEDPLPVPLVANWINERKRVSEDISA